MLEKRAVSFSCVRSESVSTKHPFTSLVRSAVSVVFLTVGVSFFSTIEYYPTSEPIVVAYHEGKFTFPLCLHASQSQSKFVLPRFAAFNSTARCCLSNFIYNFEG